MLRLLLKNAGGEIDAVVGSNCNKNDEQKKRHSPIEQISRVEIGDRKRPVSQPPSSRRIQPAPSPRCKCKQTAAAAQQAARPAPKSSPAIARCGNHAASHFADRAGAAETPPISSLAPRNGVFWFARNSFARCSTCSSVARPSREKGGCLCTTSHFRTVAPRLCPINTSRETLLALAMRAFKVLGFVSESIVSSVVSPSGSKLPRTDAI